jgi:hypothetical protein
MKKILFALFALAVGLQSISAQSTEPSKKESGGKNYATLGQDDQSDAAQDDANNGEIPPTLKILPFQWVDLKDPSKEAKVFAADAIGAGNALDEGVDNINLDMTFKFFGEKYTKAAVVTNGFIALGAKEDAQSYGALLGSASYSAAGLPSVRLPNNIIAPFWVDIFFGNSDGYIMYRTFKPEKSDKSYDHVIIEWDDAGLWYAIPADKTTVTFQLVLFAEGGIMFQYKTIYAGGIRDYIPFAIPSLTTEEVNKMSDFDVINNLTRISVGYEDKAGLRGASWGFSISNGTTLGNELVPEWASGSASGNFLNLIDGRDRRNNAVTGTSGGSGGSCFIGKKKASLDR